MDTTTFLPKVCISVLNWNGAAHTILCLESLYRQDYSNYFIIVVDNASADDSVEQIRAAFPEVEIIRAKSNLGYAGGNELALKRALSDDTTDLFWILNNDTVVPANALTLLVEAYQQYGDALYGGVSVQQAEGRLRINMSLMTYQNKGKDRYLHNQKLHQWFYEDYFPTWEPRPVTSLHGGTFMIPLTVARQYGFMNTDFFLYGEEADYCLRMGKAGIKSILVPESLIFHEVRGSSRNTTRLGHIIVYYQFRNGLNVQRRHGSFLSISLYIIHLAIMTAKSGWFSLWGQSEKRLQTSYMLTGIMHGLRGRMGKTYAPEDFLFQD